MDGNSFNTLAVLVTTLWVSRHQPYKRVVTRLILTHLHFPNTPFSWVVRVNFGSYKLWSLWNCHFPHFKLQHVISCLASMKFGLCNTLPPGHSKNAPFVALDREGSCFSFFGIKKGGLSYTGMFIWFLIRLYIPDWHIPSLTHPVYIQWIDVTNTAVMENLVDVMLYTKVINE